jgi:hypothetical protein
MVEHSDHYWITTTAGWDYQTNSRGWVIYRNPLTRLWQTHTEAISIIQGQVSSSERSTLLPGDPTYRR